jgi:hypothetical protein
MDWTSGQQPHAPVNDIPTIEAEATSAALMTSSARNTSSALRRQAAQLSILDRRSKLLQTAVDDLRQGIGRALTAVTDSSAASKYVVH